MPTDILQEFFAAKIQRYFFFSAHLSSLELQLGFFFLFWPYGSQTTDTQDIKWVSICMPMKCRNGSL